MPLKSIEPAVLSKSMSIVTTEPIQITNLKVIDLVEMGRFPYTNFWGKLTEEDDRIVHESMQIMGIEELALRNYNELSDGEKQKTLIAKALAQNTSIILLDEPTAYLDFPSKVAILNDLKNIAHSKGIGIVLSTHDIELALKMADLIWLFPKNEKVISGIPEDLVIKNDIQRIFTNEFLTFDLKTAHFTQIIKTRELISITDNSIEMEWLKRALLRKGISTSPSNNLELKVHFNEKEKEFTLENNNSFKTFKSISEILQEIETQMKNKI
jgi:iron complex transport system ATP-binding protein